MLKVTDRMPAWFDPGVRYAGALDDVSTKSGLIGWALDLSDINRRFEIIVVSAGQKIARGETSAPRPEIGSLIGLGVDCGFQIEWSAFDKTTLAALVEHSPKAELEVLVSDLGMLLPAPPDVGTTAPLTISDIFKYVKADPENKNITDFVDSCHRCIRDDNFIPPSQLSYSDNFVFSIHSSRLFDMKFYLEFAKLNGSHELDGPLIYHYFIHGERKGFKPNPFFDPRWYARKYLSDSTSDGALQHYVENGEASGNKPSPIFDPQWYRRKYLDNSNKLSPLSHFLQHKHANKFNPNQYFDIEFYLASHPDISSGQIDGFSHWLGWGIFEGRSGSPNFNPEYVWRRYLGNNRKLNAFEIFLDIGLEFGWEATPSASSSIHRAAAESSAPGPLFEGLAPFTITHDDGPKVVAMYLPQFHPIPENDAWWGEGFTEWRNLARALPSYVGHIQPRIPRDLGFYDLIGSKTLRRQVALAKHSGVHGFCYYYYNFNGRRLLEQPVETFLQEIDIDFPFCILWANENWTRRWDGMDQEILIRQNYRQGEDPALISDIARHMKDRRYMRSADGRPYFFIYRADLIPDCASKLERWRQLFRAEHALEPLILVCQTFGVEDPRPFGADGALEFPPHKLTNAIPLLNSSIEFFDPEFSGQVFDYKDIVQASAETLDADYPLIKTAFPNWDNTARRQSSAMSIARSKPEAFEAWMATLIQNAQAKRCFGDAIVFVNAWNEWCEGAYLEPDTHFGFAYLNALRRSIGGGAGELRRIALIGHDAFPSGAQQLLLALGKLLKRQFGLEISFVLLDGGALEVNYRETAETYIASEARGDPWANLRAHLSDLFRRGFRYAICNTVAAGGVAELLETLKFEFCSLVHELPMIIRSRSLVDTYEKMTKCGRATVYPNTFVKSELDGAFGVAQTAALVIPQGLYNIPSIPTDARLRLREEFGLPMAAEIVLNVGYGDLRKGIDLFLSLAEHLLLSRPSAYFVWLGDIHPDLEPWLSFDIRRRNLHNVVLAPFDRDIGRFLGGADVFLSTSREDPFPSAILEALAVGIPVIAFENTGGHAELLANDRRLGVLAPYADVPRCAKLIIETLVAREIETLQEIDYRKNFVATRFDFSYYGAKLLGIIEPRYGSVSVVVPNYNYGLYLKERLESIFRQTFPIFEILLLDDASTDDSLGLAREVAAKADRTIAVRPRASNSGSPFRQWKAGLDEIRGEFVWIAEADDTSHPVFLSEAIRRLSASPGAAFCFTDSQAISSDGSAVYRNYKSYYRETGDQGLEDSGAFSGEEFLHRFLSVRNLIVNVSAVVWRTEALREVFLRLGDEAFALRCAGDWRIYIEACRLGKDVLYISTPLNIHRRHDQSVTGRLDKRLHLKEIEIAQNIALAHVGAQERLRTSAIAWRAKIAHDWNLEPD